MEQPHVEKVVTPIIDMDIECIRTPSSISGWSYEKILLISQLQKWKHEAISLQEGMISLKEHQREIETLHERWIKEDLKKGWNNYKKKEALKKQEEQLLVLQQ